MFPTTGPEASLTVVLVAVPLFSALQLLIPRCFGTRPDQDDLDRHLRGLAITWPILLLFALTMPALSRKARAELGMGSSSSPWYLWIGAAVAALYITATAVETVRAARSEVKLRPVAEELLQDAHPLHAVFSASEHPEARNAHLWLAQAHDALDAGRGRTAVRYLRRAMSYAEHAPGLDTARATPIPINRIRQRVNEIDETAGPFSSPPFKA